MNRQRVFPLEMVIQPRSRNPLCLEDQTRRTVMDRPVPRFVCPKRAERPLAAIVVVCFNNLVFTRMCLESVLANTHGLAYEVLIVDNGSTDGTSEYLRQLAARHAHLNVLFDKSNRGFARATNQALASAAGEFIVLLNNDTIVPPGWLGTLLRHLDNRRVGLVGPVTNRCGNEAQISVDYRTYGGFLKLARRQFEVRAREHFDIRVATMFCTALRRSTWRELGPLDERFEIGLFEDDDYSLRARRAGYKVVCAQDVFVHHFGKATFDELPAGTYGRLFHANKARWEQKWDRSWQPHRRRASPTYARQLESIRELVVRCVPEGAIVVIASRGDEELVAHPRRKCWHFPRDGAGDYSGFHPVDCDAAIAALENLRAQGGDFFLLPATDFWWLDQYPRFWEHLGRKYRLVASGESRGLMFDLRSPISAEHDEMSQAVSIMPAGQLRRLS